MISGYWTAEEAPDPEELLDRWAECETSDERLSLWCELSSWERQTLNSARRAAA